MIEMTAPNGATVTVSEEAAEKLVKYGYTAVTEDKPKAARKRTAKPKE